MHTFGTGPCLDLQFLGDTVRENPTHVWIEPTTRCNTRCRHCQHFAADFGADMPEEVFARVRDAVLDGGTRSVELVGYGEPLLAPHFDRMLEACLSDGMHVAFTTNGILLRDDRRVARLVRQNVNIVLSIEGTHAETHEFLRPYVKWPGMLATLECLKRNADAAGSARRYTLSFNFVTIRKNIGDLPDLVLLAAKYGATAINLFPIVGAETGHDDLRGQSLTDAPELLAEPLRKALRLASRLGVELGVPPVFREMLLAAGTGRSGLLPRLRQPYRHAILALHYLRLRGFRQTAQRLLFGFGPKAKTGKRHCLLPWGATYFASDGAVTSCCASAERMGDLNRQSWADIWNGPLYRNLRRTIHSWNPTAICRYCGLGMGINGGDDRHFSRFFGRFRAEAIALDSPGIVYGEGFHEMERHADGTPSHRWMARRATLELPRPPAGARFLRLGIIPRQPVPQPNPGRCRIGGGTWEPFDNTCPDLHFPLGRARSARPLLEIEMETAPSPPDDARELGLAIRGVAYLV